MAIAYYAHRREAGYWTEVWRNESLQHLLAVARRDPLSTYFLENLPADGIVLEGGCGLGQLVLFLREHGYDALGGDSSLAALQIHRRMYPNSPLLGLDLRSMPFADRTLRSHISVGVIEHLEDGPGDLLREFYRTLVPGGVLLVSVPWVNGYRRAFRPLIQRQQGRLRNSGGRFHQYAFSRAEIEALLGEAGFRVRSFHPYSPARGLREAPFLHKLYRRVAQHPAGISAKNTDSAGTQSVRGWRRFLYWRPMLWLFAHMILAVAFRPGS